MQTVVYISGNKVQTAVGSGARGSFRVSKVYEDRLPEGCLINGIIIDEEVFRASISNIWKQHGLTQKHVALVVNSSEFSTKLLSLPKLSVNRTRELAAKEFSQNERVADPVCDYSLLGEEQKGVSVFATMADREFINKYDRIFLGAGIKLERIAPALSEAVKLLSQLAALKDSTAVVQVLDENMLTSILWVDGRYAYSQRTRIYSDDGGPAMVGEMAGTFSAVRQFYATLHLDAPLDRVYLCGMESTLIEQYKAALAAQNVKASPLPEYPDAKCDGGNLRDYIYPSGGCIKLKKDIDMLARARSNEEVEAKRKRTIARIVPLAAVAVACIAISVWMLTENAVLSIRRDQLQDFMFSPEVIANREAALECIADTAALNGQAQGIIEAREAIDSYPYMNTSVLASVRSCRQGSVTLEINDYDAETGILMITATAENADESNPLIARLKQTGEFIDVQYVGYRFEENSKLYSIDIACYLEANAGKEK